MKALYRVLIASVILLAGVVVAAQDYDIERYALGGGGSSTGGGCCHHRQRQNRRNSRAVMLN